MPKGVERPKFDTHPTETQVVLRIPKAMLREIGHLALDLGVHRNEATVLLMMEALAERRTKKQREG